MTAPEQAQPQHDDGVVRALRAELRDVRASLADTRRHSRLVACSAALSVGVLVSLGLPFMRAITGESNAYVPVPGWQLPFTREGTQDNGSPFPAADRIAVVLVLLATLWSWALLKASRAAAIAVIMADLAVLVLVIAAAYVTSHTSLRRDVPNSDSVSSSIPLMRTDIGMWVLCVLLAAWVVVGLVSLRRRLA